MKIKKITTALLLLLLIITSTTMGYGQITRVVGRVGEDGNTSTELLVSKEHLDTTKLSYVANSHTVQEFINYKTSTVFFVEKVLFYEDKIFYQLVDANGSTLGMTFTFSDRSLFLSDVMGNFVEVSGTGLTFCHQY